MDAEPALAWQQLQRHCWFNADEEEIVRQETVT